MAIVFVGFGFRQRGVVDYAPGLLHVSTRFLYVSGFPFAPLESYLHGPDGRVVREIGLWPKSVLLGYLRGGLTSGAALLALVGGIMAGISLVLAAASGSLGPTATPQAGDAAFVGGVAVGAALGFPLAWLHAFILDERPPRNGAHPITMRLVWHGVVAAFMALLAVGTPLAALSIRGVAADRAAAALGVLPYVASGCLAAALVLAGYCRLTLLLTPASHERATELARRFGLAPRTRAREWGGR